MDKEQELLPLTCPFCGGKAKTVRYHAHSVVVRCISCECEGPDVSANETEAIAAWNRRSSDEQAEVAWPGREFCEIAGRNVSKLGDKLGRKDDKRVAFDAAQAISALLASPPAVAAGGVTVTDAMVEVALEAKQSAYYGVPSGRFPNDRDRKEMRAALTAALAVRDEGIRVGWRDIAKDPPPPGDEVAVLDVRTGIRGVSSGEDKGHRRSFYHRNGFPATHWAPLLPPLSVDPDFGTPSRGEGV